MLFWLPHFFKNEGVYDFHFAILTWLLHFIKAIDHFSLWNVLIIPQLRGTNNAHVVIYCLNITVYYCLLYIYIYTALVLADPNPEPAGPELDLFPVTYYYILLCTTRCYSVRRDRSQVTVSPAAEISRSEGTEVAVTHTTYLRANLASRGERRK